MENEVNYSAIESQSRMTVPTMSLTGKALLAACGMTTTAITLVFIVLEVVCEQMEINKGVSC